MNLRASKSAYRRPRHGPRTATTTMKTNLRQACAPPTFRTPLLLTRPVEPWHRPRAGSRTRRRWEASQVGPGRGAVPPSARPRIPRMSSVWRPGRTPGTFKRLAPTSPRNWSVRGRPGGVCARGWAIENPGPIIAVRGVPLDIKVLPGGSTLSRLSRSRRRDS